MNCKPSFQDYDMAWLNNFLVTIDDFNLHSLIGKGGYGEVYVGIHINTGRKVAIKKLILSRLEGPDLIYFNREVQILASCDNYFLLPFIGYSNNYPYIIVTDYVPCGSLFEALRHKPGSPILSDTKKTKIALGIAIGMIALHDKNVIHRDLKSLNILLSAETLPKICDFGIARFSNSINPTNQSNFFTANIGTPHWMAPEILKSGRYTSKVDVFSYAVILWEMLTESLPFKGIKEHYQIAIKIITGERNAIPEDTPIGLKNLISKLWSQDPDLRPDFREVYRCFASHEVYFGKTNFAEIDQFVKRFPMPEKPSPEEAANLNSDHGINSSKYSTPINQEENENNEENSQEKKAENNEEKKEENNEDENNSNLQESEYIESIKQKLSEGPSKPVRPPSVIQPVKLNVSTSHLQTSEKVQTKQQIQTSEKVQTKQQIQTPENVQTIQQTQTPVGNILIEEEEENDTKIEIEPSKYQPLYIGKYLTKDNIFLQYFSEKNQPTFLDSISNDELIEEEEDENELDEIQSTPINSNRNANAKTIQNPSQIISITSSSSDDDENFDDILNGGDNSIVENFGQLSFLFHTQIKKFDPNNTKELIKTISQLIRTNHRSIVFTTFFTELSVLAQQDPEFAIVLIQADILNFLPYERTDLINDILHIVIAIIKKEPEMITDQIMKKLFEIFNEQVKKQQMRIKNEANNDFGQIIDAETEEEATKNNKVEMIITDELKNEVIPFLCILEQIGKNNKYRDSIFDMYKEKIDLFINFSQFIDIIFNLSEKFKNFQNLQNFKLNVFSKAISFSSSTESDDKHSLDYLNVIQSGYRSLARVSDTKYSTTDIPIIDVLFHLKECGQFTIEALIIISKLDLIPLSKRLFEALASAINFSEKASLMVSNIIMKMMNSSSTQEEPLLFIYESKIWLQIPPQYGMRIILILARNLEFQNEMINSNEMPSYLIKALRLCSLDSSINNNDEIDEQLKVDLVCSVISFVRYSKKFKDCLEIYHEAGFLQAVVDSTILSNNDKSIDQGLLFFDQLFHDGVWYNDFSNFVEKISKVLGNWPQKQAQRSIVVLLALGVMFPQSHPIMKDYGISKIVSKLSLNQNTVSYRDNLLQILA